MRRVLIASHGRLAEGAKSAIEFFTGQLDYLEALCAYCDESSQDMDYQVEQYLKRIAQEDELIIFTDLMGGSVNSHLLSLVSREKTHLVSGFNLALLLEVISRDDHELTAEDIQECIELSQSGIVYMNTHTARFETGDEV